MKSPRVVPLVNINLDPATLSPATTEALERAKQLATESSTPLAPAHIFLGLLEKGDILPYLSQNGILESEARLYAEAALPKAGQTSNPQAIKKVQDYARSESWREASVVILPRHLLAALVRHQKHSDFPQILESLGFNLAEIREQGLAERRGDRKYPAGHPLNQASPRVFDALDEAEAIMRSTYCARIDTPHLLLAVISDDQSRVVAWLQYNGVDVPDFRNQLRAAIGQDHEIAGPRRRFTVAAQRALDRARDLAEKEGREQWEPEHLFNVLGPHPIPWRQRLRERYRYRGIVTDPLEALLPARSTEEPTPQPHTAESPQGLVADQTLGYERAITAAEWAAASSATVEPIHLLIGIASDPDSLATQALHAGGADLHHLRSMRGSAAAFNDRYAPATNSILDAATSLAQASGHHHTGSEHLLHSLLFYTISESDPVLEEALQGADKAAIFGALKINLVPSKIINQLNAETSDRVHTAFLLSGFFSFFVAMLNLLMQYDLANYPKVREVSMAGFVVQAFVTVASALIAYFAKHELLKKATYGITMGSILGSVAGVVLVVLANSIRS